MGGYLGNRGSTAERRQRKKRDPFPLVTTRTFAQLAHSPTGGVNRAGVSIYRPGGVPAPATCGSPSSAGCERRQVWSA